MSTEREALVAEAKRLADAYADGPRFLDYRSRLFAAIDELAALPERLTLERILELWQPYRNMDVAGWDEKFARAIEAEVRKQFGVKP
jgi:hypothetical protein